MGIDVDPHNALNKLAFGPGPGDLQKVGKSGFTPWLAEQLRPPAEDDCADRIAAMRWHVKYTSKNPDAEVDEERPIAVINGGIDQHWKILDKTVPQQERGFLRTSVAVATLIRAVHSRWQLREVLADFWHNHFIVNAVGEPLIAVALPSYDRDVMRRHALGNFGGFLGYLKIFDDSS